LKKKDNCAGERKEGKKKETIVGDNPTTICYHALHHVKENTMMHPNR
jgi:hypothetical protein